MKHLAATLIFPLLLIPAIHARDIRGEIERAEGFGRKAASLVVRDQIRPFWSEDGSLLVYRVNTERGGHRFFQVDVKSGAKTPAFDHDALAGALAKAASQEVRAGALPLDDIDPAPGALRFRAFGAGWRWDAGSRKILADDTPPKAAPLLVPEDAIRTAQGSGGPTSLTFENDTTTTVEIFWAAGRESHRSYGTIEPGETRTQSTYSGHVWIIVDAAGTPLAGVVAKDTPSLARVTGKVEPKPRPRDGHSPDGKWRAVIRNHNLAIEPASGGDAILLSSDGSEYDRFTGPFHWSPDSRKLVAWRVKEVKTRQVHIVQSSPPDQLQPKLISFDYAKPGDPIRQPKPCLFDIKGRRQLPIDDALFDNPWEISKPAWDLASSEFSFLYNQRGHQLMRVVGIRADSGSSRTILEERSDTFIDYSQKTWLHRLPETRELIWASERDGFNHLYLIDDTSGRIKNRITQGSWNVREVADVDAEKRELLLKVIGVPHQDPYHAHFVRIGFDGAGFTRLSAGDGNHSIEFPPDRKSFLDTWSRADLPPVVELRRMQDGSLITELERADDAALRETGWSRPERFTAKGRDGKTDIHGIVIRPANFDPAKRYPVVEDIYAGPHDFFVPKNYLAWSRMNAMAELGFVVVKIDGMGTNWRNKAFHDVCWKNLADSGFPDRIAWIKAAAATRPWMDLTRVGIYGGSAGGQNTLAGLLHHGDFYKVGVADCGCHDNRMDKIWWNEAWMGWPVDESYTRNSNVIHADKLTGKLMLIVGELDHNVDPASTAQVVTALQDAGKDFEFLPIMNEGHGAAETPYGNYRRADFLVRHLQGK